MKLVGVPPEQQLAGYDELTWQQHIKTLQAAVFLLLSGTNESNLESEIEHEIVS